MLLAANSTVFFTLLTVTLHRRWQPIKMTKNIQPQVPHQHLMFKTALEASPFSLFATFNMLRSTTTFFSSQILNSWANLQSHSINFLGGPVCKSQIYSFYGLIRKLQIRKILWCSNSQVANLQVVHWALWLHLNMWLIFCGSCGCN